MARGNSAYNGPTGGNGASAGNSPGMGSAVVPEAVDNMSGTPLRLVHWWGM